MKAARVAASATVATLVFVALFANVSAVSPTRITALALAEGDVSVIWRDSTGQFEIVTGSGMVLAAVQGEARGAGPDFYLFETVHLSLILQASWQTGNGASYEIMVKTTVSLDKTERGVLTGDAHPGADAFIIPGHSWQPWPRFEGFLTAGEERTSVEGRTRIWALTPETSFQPASAKYLSIRLELYPNPSSEVVSLLLGWSETSQTVGGVALGEATRYTQQVRLLG